MNSILISVKKLLGLSEEDDSFDTDVMFHINTVFSALTQMGIGPSNGFMITGAETEWNDFIQDNTKIEMLKTYVYMRVKLMFDPPTNTSVLECLKELIKELEWRLFTEFDLNKEASQNV